MRMIFLIAAVIWTAAYAEQLKFTSSSQQTMLLELYTSEGCSSCPPAEKWLAQLKHDPRLWREIVPLAYHVDYWNYLGWRDLFSKKRWSTRQRQYRQTGGVSSVYTPAFVINGREWKGWFESRRLPVSDVQAGKLVVDVLDESVSAEYYPADKDIDGWQLHVALLGFGIETTVTAGENAGKDLTHDFVVLDIVDVDSADGHWNLTLPRVDQPQVKRLGLAAWVTERGRMTPLQAVGGWLH